MRIVRTITLDEALWQKIQEVAKKEEHTAVQTLRVALREYLKNHYGIEVQEQESL